MSQGSQAPVAKRPPWYRQLSPERLLFGGVVLAAALAFPPLASVQPWHASFATFAQAIILEAFPWLLIGALIGALVEQFLPDDLLPRFSRRLGPFALFGAIAIAPLVPVCECGVVPVVRSLLAKGLRPAHALAFLLAAPILNPTVLFTTWLAFQQVEMPAYRAGGAILVAVVVALLAGLVAHDRWLTPAIAATCRVLPPALGRLGPAQSAAAVPPGTAAPFPRRRLAGALAQAGIASGEGVAVRLPTTRPAPVPWMRLPGLVAGRALDHFLDMAGYFLVGVFIAAGLKTFIGTAGLQALGAGQVGGPLTMMGTSFVLSLCAEADAFVGAAFTEFSRPAVLAFLVFGPMFDLKLLLMYRAVFRGWAIAALAGLITCLVLGYVLLVGLWW